MAHIAPTTSPIAPVTKLAETVTAHIASVKALLAAGTVNIAAGTTYAHLFDIFVKKFTTHQKRFLNKLTNTIFLSRTLDVILFCHLQYGDAHASCFCEHFGNFVCIK